jgi:hypothetical protein
MAKPQNLLLSIVDGRNFTPSFKLEIVFPKRHRLLLAALALAESSQISDGVIILASKMGVCSPY